MRALSRHNFQKIKVEMDGVNFHLPALLLVQCPFKLIWGQPMRLFLVLQPPGNIALLLVLAQVSKLKQQRDHFVLLPLGKGGQLLFDFPDAHTGEATGTARGPQALLLSPSGSV